MTQFQHTLKQLLTGEKTETSRIIRPGQDYAGALPHFIPLVYRRDEFNNYTTIFKTGADYAIQPGRGQRSVGRYRIEKIWLQDVRTVTEDQVEAEGFDIKWRFLQTWIKMHDNAYRWEFDPQRVDYWINTGKKRELVGWETVQEIIDNRPAEHYMAWRMKIAVLWETVDWDAPAVSALQIPKRSVY